MAVLALSLFSSLPARGQYMSFFGDSTWEYRIVSVMQSPDIYQTYPPDTPNPLNVYCQTFLIKFDINEYYLTASEFPPTMYYFSESFSHYAEDSHTQVPMVGKTTCVREDVEYGRLYVAGELVCDMSLMEGDTFATDGVHTPDGIYHFFGKRTMIVDSVRYVSGRKVIHLSLLDHQDDYFFGTEYADQHANYSFSIRFIEGIGPTYGIVSNEIIGMYGVMMDALVPGLTLLLCMHKDDSLVYMADEDLGCVQTHIRVGISEHNQMSEMVVYPNPARQFVQIDWATGGEMDGSVVITDMVGRRLLQQKVAGTSCRIGVANLPAGLYFLTYADEQRTVTKKFLKE